MARSQVKQAARTAERSPVARILARSGYVVLGTLHVMVGAIAISIATGPDRAEADQSGAMSQLSRSPVGEVVLWLIAAGLFALALWQCAEVITVRVPEPAKRWAKRLVEASKGVAYAALGVTALIFAVGGRKSETGSTRSLSASLIAAPGGVFLLVAIGLVTAGVAVGFGVRGISRSFERTLMLPGQPWRAGVVTLGVFGYVAKGVALAIVGVLFVVAAVSLDPKQASGLGGALKWLTQLPYGELLLWVIGVGLIAYGLFCMARAALERL